MLNGDVLTDIDLSAQLRQHEQTGARITLGLIGVEDPSAYGLVRRDEDGSVTEFLEKPSPDEIDTNLISAGAYVIEREVLDSMPPAGTKLSIERDVFPALVGNGLYGFEASGYWLDIGTPAALPAGDLRHPRRRGQDRGRPRGRARRWGAAGRRQHGGRRQRSRSGADRSRLRGRGRRDRRRADGAGSGRNRRGGRPHQLVGAAGRAAALVAARGSASRSSARA